jgi:hypothetical protein
MKMATWAYVSVPRDAYRFPDICPACLKPKPEASLRLSSDQGYFKRFYVFGSVFEHLWVQVPFCTACAARQMRWKKIGQCLLVLALVSGVGIGIFLDMGRWPTILLTLLLAAPAFWLMDCPRLSVRVLWYSKDRLGFSFKHPQYAHDFALLNGQIGVVLPDGKVMYGPKPS